MKIMEIFECGNPRTYNMVKMLQADGDSKKQQFADFLPHIDFEKVTAIANLKVSSTEYRNYYSFDIDGEGCSIEITIELHWGYAKYDSYKIPMETNSSQIRKLHNNILEFWKTI